MGYYLKPYDTVDMKLKNGIRKQALSPVFHFIDVIDDIIFFLLIDCMKSPTLSG